MPIRLLFIIFLAPLICLRAQAESEASVNKKWQFGLGIGNQFIADYRGSSYYQSRFIPIPFIIYNGDFLKIDRDGARGEYQWSEELEFNISADAALNGDSSDNPLREGMPELNSAFEIGPSVNWALPGSTFKDGWSLRIPVRSVYTLGSEGFGHQGYVFSPKLTWRKSINTWITSVNLGPLWASEDYHDYYYGIAETYATASRPSYQARAGYSGFMGKLSLKRNFGAYWLGAFVRADLLHGAVFLDSPLIEEKTSGSVGLAAVYLF